MSRFPAQLAAVAHLAELARLIDRDTRLPAGWENAVAGTLLAVMRDEHEQTTSAGVVVIPVAMATGGAFDHVVTLAVDGPKARQWEMDALAQQVAKWLPQPCTVKPSASAASVSLRFVLDREAERAFQAAPFAPAPSALEGASGALAAVPAPRPWWQFW